MSLKRTHCGQFSTNTYTAPAHFLTGPLYSLYKDIDFVPSLTLVFRVLVFPCAGVNGAQGAQRESPAEAGLFLPVAGTPPCVSGA